MAGRRPKPAALHALAGNPGKRKRAPDLDLEAHSGQVPRELEDAAARLVWERQIRPLCKLGAVKRAHHHSAILACHAIADALEIEERRRERERSAKALLRTLRDVSAALAGLGAQGLEPIEEEVQACLRAVTTMAGAWSKQERPTAVRAEARQWLSEFGLTPSSSAKIVAAGGQDNPLAKFLRGLDA